MDLFSSHIPINNGSPNNNKSNTIIASGGAGDKLKKLQITNKKENTNSYRSSSSLFMNKESNKLNNETNKSDYEEILITIRKSEKGFGFELKNGILIVRVLPNSPAFNSGIKVGDLILKVNGTCVRSKDANEITSMIHESNSFVSLALQRKINAVQQSDVKQDELSLLNDDKTQTLKNVTNQLNNSIDQLELDNINAYENQLINELSESCREDNENNKKSLFFIQPDDLMQTKTDPEINDEQMNTNESSSSKLHRKQFSIPDDWTQEENLNDKDVQRREIKKTLSNTNSKSYQTKSLSNIMTKSTLAHSTSDNELDQAKQRHTSRSTFNETDLFIPYKDDLAMTSESSLDDNTDKPSWDLSSFTTYSQLMIKPVNVAIFLNYLLSSSDSPKNLYFCMFAEELINSNEKKETILRWSYELYSTFLMQNAPLKLKTTDALILKFEDCFDKNSTEIVTQLKKLFEDARLEAVDVINIQLNKFREVNQMGLANLFQGGNELVRTSQTFKNDSDQFRNSLSSLFTNYIQELSRSNDLNRISADWNDCRIQEAHFSAMISSFVTYLKRYNIPVKHFAKFELDKIPVFVNKKFKPKKQPANTIRNHSFVEYLCTSSKSICFKCKLPFWGIGNQGLICQKLKCEIKFHRNCILSGLVADCQGLQKTIKTDYKEKLDSFQKILFGSKKKEEDTSSFFIQGFSGSSDSQLNQKKDYERQASITSFSTSSSSQTSGSYSADLDNHNLPVEMAIKKFESLVNRPSSSQMPANVPKIRLTSDNTAPDELNPNLNTSISSSDNFSFFLSHNSQPPFPPVCMNKNIKIKRNSNIKGKDQACKRVGSLKTDVKKVKTHITRSKSDPHPDDIKNAISTDLNKSANTTNTTQNRFSIDLSGMDQNESILSHQTSINSNNQSSLPVSSPKNSTTMTSHPKASSSLTKTNTSLSNNSRNSWMNDSDMEVDEELPNLSVNIEREKFEQLTKKDVKVQEVINELIHTEQKHVRNLKIMKNHFYVPIKLEILLTEDERNLLFPNLDEILELHSTFNNKLKKLRKENQIVPVKHLIDVIQDQFQGENGNRFQSACATFCQNQSEAMKFLQTKSKMAADKFTAFLGRSENDVICRKLHLKDFLPTEVQRLVKYRLLFQELTKNTDDENKKRLVECIDASCKISLYVNKAVTECENKKRVVEIQYKLDTKEFDQYCVRSPVLSPYRNLQLITRKLVYEGELEWKLSNIKLMALLFEDILVFLEIVRHESSNDEKRRYVLRPLIYIIGKTKQMFTPVIPLSCINSFRSMHDKRSFHLVAIIEDSAKLAKHSTMLSSKPIQAQMLFILIAKSGDERNKWTSHLQELTGKMMQSVGNDIQNSNVQDLTSNGTSKLGGSSNLTNTISATNLMTNYAQPGLKNSNSISSSALITSKNLEFSNLDSKITAETSLTTQLEKNTSEIISLLKNRHELVIKMLKSNNPSNYDSKSNDLNIFDNECSNSSKVLLSSSIGLLNTMTTNLIGGENTSINSQHAKSIQILIKLEEYLNKLNRNLNESKLPDLKNTMITIDKKQPSIGSSLSRGSRDYSNQFSDSVADAVSTTTTSELTNNDLSEDEQINYYDEYDYNSSNDNINDNENFENSNNLSNHSVLRRFSDSSNKTLCVLTPATAIATKKKSNMNVDADDEDDMYSNRNTHVYTDNNDVNSEFENDREIGKYSRKNSSVNFETNHIELENKSPINKLTGSQSSSDLNDGIKKQSTLKYSETFDGGSEIRKSFRSSNEIFKNLSSETKPITTNYYSPVKADINKENTSLSASKSPIIKLKQSIDEINDSSDDEVKEFNFDEISHV